MDVAPKDRVGALTRDAAERLAAEMDPSLSSRVDRVLRVCDGREPDRPVDRDGLATFVVACAHAALRLSAEAGVAAPDDVLTRALLRHFGIDEGIAPDQERIIDVIVEAVREAGKP